MRHSFSVFAIAVVAGLLTSCGGSKVDFSETPVEMDYNYNSNYSTYYNFLASNFATYPNKENEIVFLGDSITDWANWNELFGNERIINRGIGGDIIPGLLYRLEEVTESMPEKIFLMIGTNDLARDYTLNEIKTNYTNLIDQIQEQSPSTEIYVQSILPTNNDEKRPNEEIRSLNNHLESLANSMNYTYIDLFSHFTDRNGKLNMDYSYDGLHLNGKGYLVWKNVIEGHVNGEE